MSKSAMKISVRGRVQGVGFRYFTYRQAGQYGLTGYVRNRADGSVEIYAEGPPDALEPFLAAVRRGPHMARVTDCDVREADPGGEYIDFQITG